MRANAATWQANLKKHLAPTILPRMNIWLEPAGHVKQGRILLGREALLCQGFPTLLFLEALDNLQQQALASAKAQAAGPAQAIVSQQVQKADKKRKISGNEKPAPVPRQRDLAYMAAFGIIDARLGRQRHVTTSGPRDAAMHLCFC